jgi:hypothetical protein
MIELADAFLDKKKIAGRALQQTFENCISDFHDSHIILFAAYPAEDRPTIEILIAHNRSNGPALLVSGKSAVIKKSPYAAVGCGSLHCGLNAPPTASQAFISGVTSETQSML